MASDERKENCFTVGQEKLCINENFRPGKFIKNESWSRVKLIIDSSSVFRGGVAYIERHGDARDNPGKTLYDYALTNAEKNLKKLDDNENFTLFKSLTAGRESDYLFFAKQSGEYFIYSCSFVNICSIQGSYDGKLSIRIDFDASKFDRQDMAGLFAAFMDVQSKIIKE